MARKASVITAEKADEESMLNKHLDEIIYFFQSTEYDLVVIEDLDRFENPDIFVTLREINGLINTNSGIHRRIRFLYALRDDIFINTDRTKFFEFIVPVIPVINHSNSVDKVLEHCRRIGLDTKLDTRFVRDVSRYLSDLRLIRNIFNEYLVYSSNLEAAGEDVLIPEKLLAVVIYKNVIPSDFAALHRQDGVLSKVMDSYAEFVARSEAALRSKLAKIESDLARVEAGILRDLSELRKVYAMSIISLVPVGYIRINFGHGSIELGQLPEHPDFETILAQPSLSVGNPNGYTMGVDLKGIEAKLDPAATYAQRKADISRRSTEFRSASGKQARELKAALATLRTRKFYEVVRESADLIEEIFSEVGESGELLRYLVLEGYLDDSYYQYISLFHTGRLSPNDNKYLIQIRSYRNPPPDFQVDNVAEVIAAMRNDDFGQNYVLNRFIVDFLLEHAVRYPSHLEAFCTFLEADFPACEDFFRSYYLSGKYVPQLVTMLCVRWSTFVAKAMTGPLAASHAARILANAPREALRANAVPYMPLATYVSRNIQQVLNEAIVFDTERLGRLGVEIHDLPSIAGFPDVAEFIASKGLYLLSINNVRYVFEHVIGWSDLGDLDTRHYSTLLQANDEKLLRRVNRDFGSYLREVILPLDGNTSETVPAIIGILNRDDVESEEKTEFLRKQTAMFPSFDGVPNEFHVSLLDGRKIEGTWPNCLTFIASEVFDASALTSYLEDADIRVAISRVAVPAGDEARPLRSFLIKNDNMEINTYRTFVHLFPTIWNAFPSVGQRKLKVLIEEQKVKFSPETVKSLPSLDLQVLFVALNFEAYLDDRAAFEIDDSFRTRLLSSTITDEEKLAVIGDMDSAFVAGDPAAAAVIGSILDRVGASGARYASDFVNAVVIHSAPELQISLLNKLHGVLTDEDVMHRRK